MRLNLSKNIFKTFIRHRYVYRQPVNVLTAKEADKFHQQNSRQNKVKSQSNIQGPLSYPRDPLIDQQAFPKGIIAEEVREGDKNFR